MKGSHKNLGFTLVEVLVYTAVFSVFVGSLFVVWSSLNMVKVKNASMTEVEYQGLYISRIISQKIRNANSIVTPVAGGGSGSLVLPGSISFQLSGGNIQLIEGINPAINLNNDKVTVSGLSFENRGLLGTNGSVRYSLTLTYNVNNSRGERVYTRTFYGSSSIKY